MSPPSTDYPVERVPVELWKQIIQDLALDSLLVVMRVCSLWRAIATECDVYVMDICLRSQHPSALELFLHRLERTGSRPSAIRVVVDRPWDAFSKVIVPAIAGHLHHLGSLDLQFVLSEHDSVMDCLARHRAPRLHTLRLDVSVQWEEGLVLPFLPENLLENNAPSLRVLSIKNVDFTPGHLPHAFSTIADISFGYSNTNRHSARSFPVHFWDHCRALVNLTLTGEIVVMGRAPRHAPSWSRLERVHMAMGYSTGVALSFLPFLEDLQIVSIEISSHDSSSTVRQLISHIPGPLDAVITHTRTGFGGDMFMTGRISRRSRVITARWNAAFAIIGHVLLSQHEAWDRIACLTVSSSMWNVLCQQTIVLPSLVSLRVVFGDHANLAQATADDALLDCPALETLIVCCEHGPGPLGCATIAALVKGPLRLVNRRCGLVLENVLLEGPVDHGLEALFSEVRNGDLGT